MAVNDMGPSLFSPSAPMIPTRFLVFLLKIIFSPNGDYSFNLLHKYNWFRQTNTNSFQYGLVIKILPGTKMLLLDKLSIRLNLEC